MRKKYFVVAVIALLSLAGFGCAPTPTPKPNEPVTPPVAAFGSAVTLAVGDSATYDDGLVVRLTEINDSRCPQGVQCVWQGELAPALRLSGGGLAAPLDLRFGTIRGLKKSAGGYDFAVSGVTTASITLVVSQTTGAAADHSDKIRLTSPQPDEAVMSPLVVMGEARGIWYFEASFPAKLFDADGKLLASAPAQAQGDWMAEEFVPFAVSLAFDRPATETGTLVLEKDNPSGLPENADEIRIPVRFAVEAGETRAIKLYRYEPARDTDENRGGVQCTRQGLVAVERSIPVTETPIQDAIRLLLKGGLTDAERAVGITTEFPLAGVELKGANLQNGVLTLEFIDPNNSTGGGACRVGILWFQIEATAKQFPGVSSVRFIPEELFQP